MSPGEYNSLNCACSVQLIHIYSDKNLYFDIYYHNCIALTRILEYIMCPTMIITPALKAPLMQPQQCSDFNFPLTAV